jgi:hypothetical protein
MTSIPSFFHPLYPINGRRHRLTCRETDWQHLNITLMDHSYGGPMILSCRSPRFLWSAALVGLTLAVLAIVGATVARPAHAGFPWFKKGQRTAPPPPAYCPPPGVGEGAW